MMKQLVYLIVAVAGIATLPDVTRAVTVPFTEKFNSDVANWLDSTNSALLRFKASGGHDGSSFASGVVNFQNLSEGDDPVIFRGTTSVLGASSDGSFFGDWISDKVSTFSAQVRHDASVPLTFFTRFAAPANFPGAFAIQLAPVAPNVWTELELEISPSSQQFVTFEGQTFSDIFGDIGNVQIGIVDVPAALAGMNQDFLFDIDQITVVPEPSTAVLVLLGLALFGDRQRVSRTQK